MSRPPHDPLLNARRPADIVTCAQSLHHTEPEGTPAEIGRILRVGGVFAASDYDVPPAVHWEAERAFAAFMDRVRLPVLELGLSDDGLGLRVFREVAQHTLGDEGLPWYVSYRVRVGIT